nr:SDR family oxidoreductase [Bradyrhizobium sp. 190]
MNPRCCAGSCSIQYDVNCIAPGRILSDLTAHPRPRLTAPLLRGCRSAGLERLKRVAHVAAFLASPMAGYITGATIDITGGEFAA